MVWWPRGYGAALVINEYNLGKLFAHMCLCHKHDNIPANAKVLATVLAVRQSLLNSCPLQLSHCVYLVE